MDYTVNYTIVDSECTGTPSITISSSLFDDYIAALPSPNYTLQLTVEICDGATITLTLDENDITENVGADDSITILPADLGMETSISDGIYSLTLSEVSSNGSTTNEYACIFVNCQLQCTLQDFINDNWTYVLSGASGLHFIYDVLNNTSSCGDCNCTKVCTIYKKFIEILNTTNPSTDDCGCS